MRHRTSCNHAELPASEMPRQPRSRHATPMQGDRIGHMHSDPIACDLHPHLICLMAGTPPPALHFRQPLHIGPLLSGQLEESRELHYGLMRRSGRNTVARCYTRPCTAQPREMFLQGIRWLLLVRAVYRHQSVRARRNVVLGTGRAMASARRDGDTQYRTTQGVASCLCTHDTDTHTQLHV